MPCSERTISGKNRYMLSFVVHSIEKTTIVKRTHCSTPRTRFVFSTEWYTGSFTPLNIIGARVIFELVKNLEDSKRSAICISYLMWWCFGIPQKCSHESSFCGIILLDWDATERKKANSRSAILFSDCSAPAGTAPDSDTPVNYTVVFCYRKAQYTGRYLSVLLPL